MCARAGISPHERHRARNLLFKGYVALAAAAMRLRIRFQLSADYCGRPRQETAFLS